MTIAASPDRTRGDEGFTLLELLVTTTLLSLVVLLLFGGLHFGVRAWDGSQAHGARSNDLRVVQELLRREIEQAYPLYDATDPVHPVVDFHGSSRGMTFLAPAPLAVGSVGRSRITVSGIARNGQLQLVMHGAPELAVSQADGWTTTLAGNIATLEFAYFGSGRWSSTWAGQTQLPSLVRIHIGFRSGDGRVFPDMIIAPKITTDTGCVYDYTSKRCQGRA